VTGTLTLNEEVSPTIRAQANNNTPAIAVRTANTSANGSGLQVELGHTVDTTGPEAVAYAVRMREGCEGGGKGPLVQEEVSGTLATGNDQTIFEGGYVVRRLTPLECERLQGFPDGWTDIGEWVDEKGKTRKTTDGARYKALGNSFAVPVIRWIGERIEEVDLWL
jgi:DNA (cytosine-5)-methyltransferase 1